MENVLKLTAIRTMIVTHDLTTNLILYTMKQNKVAHMPTGDQ